MALEGTYTPDALFAGFQHEPVSSMDIIKTGLSLVRGTLLAREVGSLAGTPGACVGTGNGTIGAVTVGDETKEGVYALECLSVDTAFAAGTPSLAGTGNGTCTGEDVGVDAQAGDYVITCIQTTVGGGLIFKVIAPNGDRLDDLVGAGAYVSSEIEFTVTEGGTDYALDSVWTITVTGTTSGGVWSVHDPNGGRLADATTAVAYSNDHLGFTIAAGATPFAVGDTFAITAALVAGSGHLIVANTALSNGGETLVGILAADCDASSAATRCTVFLEGEFNATALTFGGTDDADNWREQGRQIGIHFRTNLAAA